MIAKYMGTANRLTASAVMPAQYAAAPFASWRPTASMNSEPVCPRMTPQAHRSRMTSTS